MATSSKKRKKSDEYDSRKKIRLAMRKNRENKTRKVGGSREGKRWHCHANRKREEGQPGCTMGYILRQMKGIEGMATQT